MVKKLSGLQIYTPEGIMPSASVLIENGVIQDVGYDQVVLSQELHFPSSYHLVPGFIDMHVHGANGYDVMDGTERALDGISHALALEGTTAFLATTMTSAIPKLETAIANVAMKMQQASYPGAQILGLHLEGPFLAASKMGAQCGDYILEPNIELIKQWQILSGRAIKLITIAPEYAASLDLIRFLAEHQIIASLGHSNATFDQAMAAIHQGASHATHLFNAMRAIHHREPGLVTAALLSDQVFVELIVDGLHLHPAIVEMVLKLKPQDKILLVTDAMRAKCLGDGCYELGGQEVIVKKDRATLADGTLAGSVLPMISAVKNLVKFTGCQLEVAVKMASENPAKALGIFHKKGSISRGKDADLVVLDDKLNVVLTLCQGEAKQDISHSHFKMRM